jgi:hypothetical protein
MKIGEMGMGCRTKGGKQAEDLESLPMPFVPIDLDQKYM